MAKVDKRRQEHVAPSSPRTDHQPLTTDHSPTPRGWIVKVPGSPERMVFAVDEAGAVAEYRREMGIVSSEQDFKVGPADAE